LGRLICYTCLYVGLTTAIGVKQYRLVYIACCTDRGPNMTETGVSYFPVSLLERRQPVNSPATSKELSAARDQLYVSSPPVSICSDLIAVPKIRCPRSSADPHYIIQISRTRSQYYPMSCMAIHTILLYSVMLAYYIDHFGRKKVSPANSCFE